MIIGSKLPSGSIKYTKTIRFTGLLSLVIFGLTAIGQDSTKYEFKRIADNSFLIEEAYNQDPATVQHINSFQYLNNKSWVYTFTDEWPLAGKKHQISAMIPVFDAGSGTGVGDIAINYRYQAVETQRLGFSPRLTLLVPTGNYRIETGNGIPGYQISLPLSFLASRKIVTHYNLGATVTPDARSPEEQRFNLVVLNYGTSLIWLVSENFNFMLEIVGNSLLKTPGSKVTEVTHSLFINPGFRAAINFPSGLQIVPGVAIPIGISPSGGSCGVFVYLSFEGPLWKVKEKAK
jgi:hypothetical protein